MNFPTHPKENKTSRNYIPDVTQVTLCFMTRVVLFHTRRAPLLDAWDYPLLTTKKMMYLKFISLFLLILSVVISAAIRSKLKSSPFAVRCYSGDFVKDTSGSGGLTKRAPCSVLGRSNLFCLEFSVYNGLVISRLRRHQCTMYTTFSAIKAETGSVRR